MLRPSKSADKNGKASGSEHIVQLVFPITTYAPAHLMRSLISSLSSRSSSIYFGLIEPPAMYSRCSITTAPCWSPHHFSLKSITPRLIARDGPKSGFDICSQKADSILIESKPDHGVIEPASALTGGNGRSISHGSIP